MGVYEDGLNAWQDCAGHKKAHLFVIFEWPFVIHISALNYNKKSECMTAYWLSVCSGGKYQTDSSLLQAVRGLVCGKASLSKQRGNCVLHTFYPQAVMTQASFLAADGITRRFLLWIRNGTLEEVIASWFIASCYLFAQKITSSHCREIRVRLGAVQGLPASIKAWDAGPAGAQAWIKEELPLWGK